MRPIGPSATVAFAALSMLPFLAHATPAAPQDDSWTESGEASWYGPRHEGLRTTSGERFDSTKLTAAHSSLPLGTLVRVTMQSTGTSVIVKINDREPPHGVRCIDLSRAAAARLGFVGRGVADVTLAEVSPTQAVEVAEAPEDAIADQPAVTRRHGRRHTRHAHR